MSYKSLLIIIFIVIIIFLGGVYFFKFKNNSTINQSASVITITPAQPNLTNIQKQNPGSGLANPASVYCEEQGGKNEIITASDGSQSGQCVFSDGRKCDEWQFFRTKACE